MASFCAVQPGRMSTGQGSVRDSGSEGKGVSAKARTRDASVRMHARNARQCKQRYAHTHAAKYQVRSLGMPCQCLHSCSSATQRRGRVKCARLMNNLALQATSARNLPTRGKRAALEAFASHIVVVRTLSVRQAAVAAGRAVHGCGAHRLPQSVELWVSRTRVGSSSCPQRRSGRSGSRSCRR